MTFKADLEREVTEVFRSTWAVRESRGVPVPGGLSPGNDAATLHATVLYADMADSTKLVDGHQHDFAAEVYKTYLRCAATIIKTEQGVITAYDGDRVMAVFLGDLKDDAAVRSAMKIHYTVQQIINPALRSHYPKKKYRLNHVVGIDTSELFVTRIGVRNDPDLVWVGRAANYAAKLCSINGNSSIYITRAVFTSLSDDTKYNGKELMWKKEVWKTRNNMRIYGSCYQWPIT